MFCLDTLLARIGVWGLSFTKRPGTSSGLIGYGKPLLDRKTLIICSDLHMRVDKNRVDIRLEHPTDLYRSSRIQWIVGRSCLYSHFSII